MSGYCADLVEQAPDRIDIVELVAAAEQDAGAWRMSSSLSAQRLALTKSRLSMCAAVMAR